MLADAWAAAFGTRFFQPRAFRLVLDVTRWRGARTDPLEGVLRAGFSCSFSFSSMMLKGEKGLTSTAGARDATLMFGLIEISLSGCERSSGDANGLPLLLAA